MADNPPKTGDTGDRIVMNNAGWNFDVDPESFESHIERSVPYYREGHDLIAKVSDFFLPDNAVAYDIGTTTGAIVRGILERHPAKRLKVTGIDVIPGMIDYAARSTPDDRAAFLCANALECDFDKSHLFILYYTLQFIHPSVRIDLLKKLYERLHWGGALLLFEKVRGPDARFQDYMGQVYKEFKLDRAFTPEQILNKERSLKGVLEPFSEAGNLTLLREAGFVDVMTIYKWVCFQGWLAIK